MNWTAFLESRGATFDASGHVRAFRSTDAGNSTDYMADLSHLAIFVVRGEDASDFLHKQFTLNMHGLAERQCVPTAWCNPKGRALATFLLYRLPDCFGLLLPADLADTVGKRLQMFVLRARVQITDQSSIQPRIGISGHHAASRLEKICGSLPTELWQVTMHDDITILRLPPDSPRFLITGPAATLAGIWEELEAVCSPSDRNQWLLEDINAGLALITATTSEVFLPQMLDLEHLGGLAYDKGCYPGQEVIARLHYRGEIKQRLRCGDTAAAPPAPGTALYGSDKQRHGTVINAAATATGSRVMAVAAPGEERLHIGNQRGEWINFEPDLS